MTDVVNLWSREEHATQYLIRADAIPHRTAGEHALLECLPPRVGRVLDLGSGDGRLLSAVLDAREIVDAVALDFSPAMLERLHVRFKADARVKVVAHNLDQTLSPELGTFDVVVSSFAIHHLTHERKRSLYAEVFERLNPGGVFCNLEHVASATPKLHRVFLAQLDVRPEDEDPSNKLLEVHPQLVWLREVGLVDVDCHWKWRELALLAGRRPTAGE